jgi:hypothetical protein
MPTRLADLIKHENDGDPTCKFVFQNSIKRDEYKHSIFTNGALTNAEYLQTSHRELTSQTNLVTNCKDVSCARGYFNCDCQEKVGG